MHSAPPISVSITSKTSDPEPRAGANVAHQTRMCTENKLTDNTTIVEAETQMSVHNNDGTESSRRKFERLGLLFLMWPETCDTKKHSKNVAHEHAPGTLFQFCCLCSQCNITRDQHDHLRQYNVTRWNLRISRSSF